MAAALRHLHARLRAQPFLLVPLFLALYGYGTIDVQDFQQISGSPFELNPESGKQFLQFSPLAYFLGYPLTTTIGPRGAFAIVMLGGLALFATALHRLVTLRYGTHRNDAALMFLATPLLIVLSQYLGKSDAYLVAFLLLLPVTKHAALQVALSALAVLSHFEIGLITLTLMVLLGILPWRAVLAGAVAGVALVLGYHYVLLPAPPMSRAALGQSHLDEAIGAVLRTPVLHLICTFGSFWLCIIKAWPLRIRETVAVATAAALACATLDFTRVFILVSVPLVISIVDWLIAARAASPRQGRADWVDALPVLALVQVHLIGDYVYDSRLPELVRRLLE